MRNCFLAACALALVVTSWGSVPAWAQGQRRTIDQLLEMLASEDRDKRRDAVHELADYGPEAEQALDGLIEAIQDNDIQIWHDATQAIAHLGPKAAPALDTLLGTMGDRSEQRRFRTAHAIGSIGIVALPAMRERLDSEQVEIREVAVRAIGKMGPVAAEAVPELIERLGDSGEHIRQCAVDGLAGMGPVAIPAVQAALEHANPTVRAGAAKTLGTMGRAAQGALPELITRSAEDTEVSVRAAVVSALGRVGTDRPEIIVSLMDALVDEAEEVRQASVEAWISVSPTLQTQATKSLVELFLHGDPARRGGVLMILNRFGPRAASATPTLLDALAQDLDSAELTTTLGQIGPAALEPTYAALREQRIAAAQVARIVQGMPSTVKRDIARKIDDPSPIVRQLAATTLGDLVPLPRDGVSILQQGIQDASARVRAAAAQSVNKVGAKASTLGETLAGTIEQEQDAAVRVEMIHALAAVTVDERGKERLLECLGSNIRHADNDVRIAVLDELAQLESLPTRFLDPLGALLAYDTPKVRSLATEAISRVEGGREGAAKLLLVRMDDENLEVQQSAIRALARLGAAAEPALERIQSQLRSESTEMQVVAIEALTQLGQRSSGAMPVLEELSVTGVDRVREAALTGVRKIAQDPKGAIAILIRGLEDREWTIRKSVARELGEMEAIAAPAIPALLKLMNDEEVSDAARSAIRSIGTAEEEALPILLDTLRDENSPGRARYYAVYLMREMGSKAKSALPTLRELREKVEGGRFVDEFDRAIAAIEKGS